MKSTDLFAVYGSLRKGMGNHRVIGQHMPELLSTEELHGWKMYSMGGFPAICESNDAENDTVIIEVYKVDEAQHELAASSLDMLEGYPSFYNRVLVDTSVGEAWVYFRKEEELSGLNLVESGDWVDYYGTY